MRALREGLNTLLDRLTVRERQVIELRFGLLDGQARTLKEISGAIGLTRERIRQVEAQALKQLRQSADMDHLRVYLAYG